MEGSKPDQNAELRRNELDLLEEKREKVALKFAAYKQQVKKCFDRRVRPRSFQVGDLVLREVSLATKNPAEGKLGSNWEGPYVVSA